MKESLTVYAKCHCANWHADGGCYLHEVIDWNATPPKAAAGVCKIALGEPCEYFRQLILPDPATPARIQLAYQQIDYGIKVKQPRTCPDCGKELLPRARYCQHCKKRRRKAAYRNSRKRTA